MCSTKATKEPTLRKLIAEQDKISNTLMEKLTANDKVLEDINLKMKDFSCAMEDQLEFNKRMEAKMSQLAIALLLPLTLSRLRVLIQEEGSPLEIPHIQKE